MDQVSVETLSALAGIVLSLVFSYAPGVQSWFDGLAPNQKRLVMLGALAAVSLGLFGLACYGKAPFTTGVSCTEQGAWELMYLFVSAALANQSTYLLSPKKKNIGSRQPIP